MLIQGPDETLRPRVPPGRRCSNWAAAPVASPMSLRILFQSDCRGCVSPGHLRLCEQMMKQRGKTDVLIYVIGSPGLNLERIPTIHFFFSTIVLQHNPPQ